MLKFIAIIVVAFTTCASAEENLLDGGLFSEVLQKAKSVTFYRPNQEPQFILNPGSPLPPGEKYEAGKDLKEFRDSFIAAKPFAPLGCIVEFAGMYEPSGFVAYDEERNPILVGAFNYAPSRKKMAVYIFAPSLNNGRPEFVFPSSPPPGRGRGKTEMKLP